MDDGKQEKPVKRHQAAGKEKPSGNSRTETHSVRQRSECRAAARKRKLTFA